ncbi:hypothetical protein BDI4_100057 [Burkholderia diffusa]|nr:hypothetical protein BDI4_100057 [Burkholderia diffusa]
MAGTYLFRCRKGHEWQTKGYDVVLNGHWCMRCARQKLRGSLAQLQEVAHARGGKCLATTYLGSQVKVDWECHLGHVWDAIPASVNSGRWCPNCANLRRTQNLRKRKRYDVDG